MCELRRLGQRGLITSVTSPALRMCYCCSQTSTIILVLINFHLETIPLCQMTASVTAFLRNDSATVIFLIFTYPLHQSRPFAWPVMNSANFKRLWMLTLFWQVWIIFRLQFTTSTAHKSQIWQLTAYKWLWILNRPGFLHLTMWQSWSIA